MFDLFKKKILKELAECEKTFTFEEESNVILMGNITIVIGDLSDCSDRESSMIAVDKLLERVLILRKGYHSAQASDMYILMVGPKDNSGYVKGRVIASEIERDDRLARKHVWLPLNNAIDSSFQAFIQTTFLSSPGKLKTENTDALSLLSADIGLPSGWEDILLDPELEGVELVESLMALEVTE